MTHFQFKSPRVITLDSTPKPKGFFPTLVGGDAVAEGLAATPHPVEEELRGCKHFFGIFVQKCFAESASCASCNMQILKIVQ